MSTNDASTNPSLSFTSGRNDPVWVKSNTYEIWPRFKRLEQNIKTHTVIAGAGFAGISTAYELVKKGVQVVLVEAREVTSGESGRSTGRMSDFLGMGWHDIIKLHGIENARMVYNSHRYAIARAQEIAEELNISCNFKKLPCHVYLSNGRLSEEVEAYNSLAGTNAAETLPSDDASNSRAFKLMDNAVFHPTRYLHSILRYLTENHPDLFSCYTHTRVKAYEVAEDGIVVDIEGKGISIKAENFVMATNVPVKSRTYIMLNGYYRTYNVATTIPRAEAPEYAISGSASVPDLSISVAEHPDPDLKYLVVSGGRHKTGHIEAEGYEPYLTKLREFIFEKFPTAASEPEFCWSSQVVDSNDHLAYIGREKPGINIFVITGDSGSGINYGLIGAKIVSDQITGDKNPWESVYDASRKPKSKLFDQEIGKLHLEELVRKSRETRNHLVDIEELPPCTGAVVKRDNDENGMPLAVWKDANGKTRQFTAVCPHAFGVLVWNPSEKTFDCPLHGSRFDAPTGRCVFGPANSGLKPDDDAAKEAVAALAEL